MTVCQKMHIQFASKFMKKKCVHVFTCKEKEKEQKKRIRKETREKKIKLTHRSFKRILNAYTYSEETLDTVTILIY